jgi:hypothetical protein
MPSSCHHGADLVCLAPGVRSAGSGGPPARAEDANGSPDGLHARPIGATKQWPATDPRVAAILPTWVHRDRHEEPRSIAVAAMDTGRRADSSHRPILGLVGPRLLAYLDQCRVKTAKLQTEGFGSAPNLFSLDGGRYPTTQEGLEALALAPSGLEVDGPGREGRLRVA